MARYYFNFSNGKEFVEDEDGLELADNDAAWAKGVECMRDVIAGDIFQGVLRTRSRIEIGDDSHRVIMSVGFGEAVRVE